MVKNSLFRCAIVVFFSLTVFGCALFNDLLGENSWDYEQGWADLNGKRVDSPEIQKAMVECKYTETMNRVAELRITYPSSVMQSPNESLDDYLDRLEDAKIELEKSARINKPKADAIEIAVKKCVGEKGITARAGMFNIRKGIFYPDNIQVPRPASVN